MRTWGGIWFSLSGSFWTLITGRSQQIEGVEPFNKFQETSKPQIRIRTTLPRLYSSFRSDQPKNSSQISAYQPIRRTVRVRARSVRAPASGRRTRIQPESAHYSAPDSEEGES